MLGRIGFGPNLLGGFPNGGGLAPLNRGVVGRRRRAQRDGRNLSQDLIKRMQVELAGLAKTELSPRFEGRQVIMVLGPEKG